MLDVETAAPVVAPLTEPYVITPTRFDMARTRRSIFAALLAARRRYGGKTVCIEDADAREMTYDELVRASFALGSALARRTRAREAVSILLPTSLGSAIAFFSLSAYGRIPAMLNFTAGARALDAACRAAIVSKIVTARKFVELGGYQELVDALSKDREIIYLEDLREGLDTVDKIRALVGSFLPDLVRARPNHHSTGVVLFTSGTEGDPKGVVLSHANIVANVEQVRQHVELRDDDVVFNPLPTFHCFGLTGGLLLPVLIGVKVVLHPSPLQSKAIPKRIRETRATFLFATDTFMQHYARAADEGDLASLRYVVCGAERVREETRQLLRRRYDLEILEGYGATETAPVVAVNPPGRNRPGTVGTLLPGIEAKLEPEPGITVGGRLLLRGPNVMKGYLFPELPGVLHPLGDGWHDTGDVVSADEDGYLTIRGRLKRFAKIGGEMVSLAVVENCASALWPDNRHAAITLPDSKKGEMIVLVTDFPRAERGELLTWAQTHGVPELAVPRRIVVAAALPVLGTGKTDYGAVKAIAEAAGAPSASAAAQ